MVKPGALIVDLGINHCEANGKWYFHGDAQLSSILPIAHIATLSNGIGFVRTAVLMNNIVNSIKKC